MDKERTICVVGMGYVGLPLAVEFDREGFDVIGYDIDPEVISQLESNIDPTNELGNRAITDSSVKYTTDSNSIKHADYVLIAVPTPVDDLKNPNLRYVESAAETIGQNLKPGAIIVLESTVYPGATREILAPTIEAESGLNAGEDFYVGYSPERMVPGDDEHGIRDVVKIVSGQTDTVRAELAELYGTIVDAGIHEAPEIEVAEAAKAIENIQRDVNIALMNELAIACQNIGLDTHDVLDAARTKWNFHNYQPGLVGGHCIPVDPFFIIYETERNGYTPKLIEQSRDINEYMPTYIADLTLRGLNDCGKVLRDSTVLVLGLSYKPGVADIRTSVVGDTIKRLQEYGVTVLGADPYADEAAASDEFGIEIQSQPSFHGVDAVLLATPHQLYREIDYAQRCEEMTAPPLIVDVDGVLDRATIESTEIEYRRV
ncbi:nucleotide sugar dehydrogenase [Haloplanus litoreus]|uniref:UDP-N-acetyl-D-mannosamine dehydrogenase n=1 Tax=Haloplanus litoreus TaxID=767515 RepID=A0ABD5ZY13_9EURY